MATAYASHSSATVDTGSGTSNLTISKPSGLAEGDVLVAILAALSDGEDWNTPSGWTKAEGVGEGSGDYNLTVLAKIADSDDENATDFTFSHPDDANTGELQGVLMRVTGSSFPSDISKAITADAGEGSNSSGTVTFSGGVTPTGPNNLLIFSVMSDVNGQNISGYAVATDDPTWTERYENSYSPAALPNHLAVATGPRSEQTATGDYSADYSDGDAFIGVLVSVTESVDASITGVTGSLSLSGNTGTAEEETPRWTPESKSSTDWTPESKS